MKSGADREKSVVVARTLGAVFFGVMTLVSVVVYLTEDGMDAVGYALIVGAPFAMGAIGYFVGLHNDPASSD